MEGLLKNMNAPGETTAPEDSGSSGRWGLLRSVLPWLSAAALFLYLFWSIDFGQFISSFYHADLFLYIPWLVFFSLVWFFMDSQNIRSVLHHFGHDISFSKVLSIRGITYFLMIINYSLGMGGIAYLLKKENSIPLKRSMGLMVIYNAVTQNCLLILAGIGCLVAPVSSALMNSIFYMCVSIVAAYIAGISILKLLPARGRIGAFRNMAFIRIFHEVPWTSYCMLVFFRGVYYSTFIIFYYFALRAFHMDVPFQVLTAYVPVILLIISLPVTPFGLGTSQAAMVLFFKDYGTEANILAFGLTYSTSILLFRGIIGLFYSRNISALIPGRVREIKEIVNEEA